MGQHDDPLSLRVATVCRPGVPHQYGGAPVTVLNLGVQPAPGVNALIFCNSCGDISIDTPTFGWKRYRHNIDITYRHHCPSCCEYNELARHGLVHDVPANDAVTYADWEPVA